MPSPWHSVRVCRFACLEGSSCLVAPKERNHKQVSVGRHTGRLLGEDQDQEGQRDMVMMME